MWGFVIVYIPHNGTLFSIDSFLEKRLSYSFNFYPSAFNVCVYKLYHCSADSIHPYIALSTLKYSTFWTFSYLTYCLYSSFISHMMSTKRPRIFSITFFSAAILACKYVHGMLKLAMSCSLYASIMSVVKSYSIYTVRDATLLFFPKYISACSHKHMFCLLLFRPFFFDEFHGG